MPVRRTEAAVRCGTGPTPHVRRCDRRSTMTESLKPPELAARKTAVVLRGGNIDMMLVSSVLQRGLVRSHRLVRLAVELPDVPGSLAALAAILGELDSNIVDIVHQRAFRALRCGPAWWNWCWRCAARSGSGGGGGAPRSGVRSDHERLTRPALADAGAQPSGNSTTFDRAVLPISSLSNASVPLFLLPQTSDHRVQHQLGLRPQEAIEFHQGIVCGVLPHPSDIDPPPPMDASNVQRRQQVVQRQVEESAMETGGVKRSKVGRHPPPKAIARVDSIAASQRPKTKDWRTAAGQHRDHRRKTQEETPAAHVDLPAK